MNDYEDEFDELYRRINLLESRLDVLEARVPLDSPEAPVDAFDEFWAMYPRKVGKALARKAFSKCKTQNTAIDGLECWLAAGAFNDDPKYILHASTWLNQKCYNDEPVPYVSKFTKPQISNGKTISLTRAALDAWLSDGS